MTDDLPSREEKAAGSNRRCAGDGVGGRSVVPVERDCQPIPAAGEAGAGRCDNPSRYSDIGPDAKRVFQQETLEVTRDCLGHEISHAR